MSLLLRVQQVACESSPPLPDPGHPKSRYSLVAVSGPPGTDLGTWPPTQRPKLLLGAGGRCELLLVAAALFLGLFESNWGFRDGGGKMAAPRDEPGSVEAEGSSGRQGSSGVKVVLPSDLATPAPLCPHGRSASGFSLAVGRQGGVSYPESTLGI